MIEQIKISDTPAERTRKDEEEMNELRSELLNYLRVLTEHTNQITKEPQEGANDQGRGIEYEAEYTLSDGREVVIYFRPFTPKEPGEEYIVGSVVISDRKLPSGRERHISYEYKMGAVVERHESVIAPPTKGATLEKVVREAIIEAANPKAKEKKAPVATAGELRDLNRILESLRNRR